MHTTVDVLTKLLQEKAAKAKRRRAADLIIESMSEEERREYIADWILRIEGAAPAPQQQPSSAETNNAPPPPKGRRETFVDKAERCVLDHPEGIRTADVATGIGQDVKSVDGTLRHAAERRGSIYYDKATRCWYPKGVRPSKKGEQPARGRRITIRDLIYQVFAAERRPLGALELYQCVQKIKSDINRTSVDGEINRMKKDKLLVRVGDGPNNGSLYNVTNGGGAHAASI